MRRYISLALLLVAFISLIVWGISFFIQPLLPPQINNGLVLFVAGLLAVLAGISGFKDVVELVQMLRKHDNSYTLIVKPDNGNTQSEKPHLKDGLPPQSYFCGRDLVLNEIMSILRTPGEKEVIGIDGMGGIGKTALTRETTSKALDEKLFDIVLWEQATRGQSPKGSEVLSIASSFDEILDAFARKLGLLDVIRLNSDEKKLRIKSEFNKQRILVVLDNLETSSIKQDEIANNLYPLLGTSKAIFTSRHRFQDNVYAVHLGGLGPESAILLIRNEATQKGVAKVTKANCSELTQIAKATGGSPLALKLIVGQLSYLPLEIVIRRLREINYKTNASEHDEYIELYKKIFLPSWGLLSDKSKKLIISMTHFVPGIGGKYEAIEIISGLTNNELADCIEEAWKLSFLEVADSSGLKTVRYYLHALTQYFVLSDIVKIANYSLREK